MAFGTRWIVVVQTSQVHWAGNKHLPVYDPQFNRVMYGSPYINLFSNFIYLATSNDNVYDEKTFEALNIIETRQ